MHNLIKSCRGGLTAFYHDYRSKRLCSEMRQLTNTAIRKIAHTIVVGPVKHTGGTLDRDEQFFTANAPSNRRKCASPEETQSSLGELLMDSSVWREMCLIGHWVAESIVLRWAELTFEISRHRVAQETIIPKLLERPTSERDVALARKIYHSLPELKCVWTRDRLRHYSFVVDHLIPFSLWYNNDLWNLLPTSRKINSSKSDRLISRQSLLRSKDLIIYYWEIMCRNSDRRFTVEINRSLLRSSIGMETNWQQAAFSGLMENVETVAIQRGIERWSASGD